MAEFKKLINPPIKASEINSESATNGQVLTANGTGGATWQDPTGGGTEVVANPSLTGTESDLTGLEVAGTKYKVPSGGGTEKYIHNIILSSPKSNIYVQVITENNTSFTLDTFISYVVNNTTPFNSVLIANGVLYSSDNVAYIISTISSSATTWINYKLFKISTGEITNSGTSYSTFTDIYDNVIPL